MKINLIALINLISNKKAPISKLRFGIFLDQLEIRIIRNLILIILISYFLLLTSAPAALAQIRPPFGGGLGSKVTGTVGEHYLTLTGYTSPFASVSLYIDNIFIRGTVANEKGDFSISQVLIKLGLTKFCLKTADAKHLGESESCITIPAASGSLEKNDIFLPPTLALSKNQIPENSSIIAYGYTKPGADVTLVLNNGQKLVAKADASGYFQFTLKNLKAGKYTLYATGKYNNIDSLASSKKLELNVLSKTGQTVAKIGDFWNWLWNLFTSWGLGILWLAIPIIILIIILILKLLPKHFSGLFKWPFKLPGLFYNPQLAHLFDLIRRKKRTLHHKWFVGY